MIDTRRRDNTRRRDIYPNRKQWEFMNSTTRHTAYGGARGGGKSWVIREQAVKDAMTYGRPDKFSSGIRICIIRQTLVDLIQKWRYGPTFTSIAVPSGFGFLLIFVACLYIKHIRSVKKKASRKAKNSK